MPLYLNTLGRGRVAVAICARCSRKMSIEELSSDPNAPGLQVCDGCKDDLDPWRLPPRMTEDISLRNPRPDLPLQVDLVFSIQITMLSGAFIIGETFVGRLSQATGVVDSVVIGSPDVLFYTLGEGLDFELSEKIVGSSSGAVAIVDSEPS